MRLKVVTSGKAADINLKGALTIGRPVEDLNRAVTAAILDGVREITLHVGGVPYADASGLGALVAGRISARAAGATLTVAGAAGKMKELMDLTCLERLRRRDAQVVSHTSRRPAPVRARRRPAFHLSGLAFHVA